MSCEEHFAPNADATSDADSDSVTSVESVEMPVKRYATRSQNATKVVKNLKEENLKLIKDKIKKEESEQLRYLVLDNANKDFEIENLQLENMKFTSIVNPLHEYEEAFKKFEKNIAVYERLIEEISFKDYNSLIMSESHEVVVVEKPTVLIDEFAYCEHALNTIYTNKYSKQKLLCETFHEKLITKTIEKKRMFTLYDYGIILVLYTVYFSCMYYLGK